MVGDTTLNVVIVGGSLTGLMHGTMLKRLGHNVRILERSLSSIRENQSAGITAGPHVQRFLEEYDSCSKPWFSSASGVKVLDKASQVALYRKMDLRNTSWDVLYYRLRANFDSFESEYCPMSASNDLEGGGQCSFECGKQVTKVSGTDECMSVEYRNLVVGTNETVSADLVVAADGANSTIRTMVLPAPDLHRPYSGYLAWRGTVREADISESTRDILGSENNVHIAAQSYLIAYKTPGLNGSLEQGESILNYAWYHNCPEDELPDILTDINGHEYRFSLPSGKIRDEVWQKQKAVAQEMLSPPFLELINMTRAPFVTVVSDTMASQASFLNGKLFLVGDALTLFRPHIAMSTNQAAFDCLLLKDYLDGTITLSQWETKVLQYARVQRLRAITWGTYFQVGWTAYLVSEVWYRAEVCVQWLSRLWGLRR